MKSPFASINLSQPVRRRVELAIAVAQERLLSTHVDHALALIEMVGDRVPFDQALEIYNRLLRISADEARVITTRALARIGERSAEAEIWPELMAGTATDDEGGDGDGDHSFFDQLRQRLRGRVNEDLRRWIELAAARTEVALMNAHVENALHFVAVLQDELPLTDAAELYLEALDVRDPIAEVVYYLTLARLSEKHLPNRPRPRALPGQPVPASAADERRLRVIEHDGG